MIRLADYKHLLLLAALVTAMILQATTHHLTNAIVSDILAAGAMLAVLLVVFEDPLERRVAYAVLGVAIVANVLRYVVSEDHLLWLDVFYRVLAIVFLGFAVAVILANIFASKTITGDAVLGTICGYLLAAAAWGNVYNLTELFSPGSFTMAGEIARHMETWDGRQAVFNYFSLVTITTMGYGDITPVRAPATVLATLEAVFGQFYIAVVVAQLVGMRMAQAFSPDKPS
jgi:hypothetical protein